MKAKVTLFWKFMKECGYRCIVLGICLYLILEPKYIHYMIYTAPILSCVLGVLLFIITFCIGSREDREDAKLAKQKKMIEEENDKIIIDYLKAQIPTNQFENSKGSTDKEKVINYIKNK